MCRTTKMKRGGIVGKLRKSVVKLRSSPQRRESFRRQCEVFGMNSLELVVDVPTRWNSTLDMIVRALKFRKPLESTIRSDKYLCALVLTDEEWEIFTHIKDFLEPFKDVTVFMSAERYATISFCGIVYSTLFKHLEKYTKSEEEYPDYLVAAARSAYAKLDKYYPSSDGNAYVIATILDPRFKLHWYKTAAGFNAACISTYISAITTEWKINYKPPIEKTNNTATTKSTSLFAQELAKIGRTETKDELELYLSQKVASVESVPMGVFKWWKNHSDDYPHLSKMAMDYLSAAGTGVPVERLFSTGPNLLTARRLSMSPEKIRECILLKSWMKFEDKVSLTNTVIEATVHKMLGDV